MNEAKNQLNPLLLYQATCMVLSNLPPTKTEAVFFHARSFGDDDGLFELAANLVNNGLASKIIINGFDGSGVSPSSVRMSPGSDDYVKRLSVLVDPSCIMLATPAKNSIEENRVFLSLAQKSKWGGAVIIAQPHQLLRLMLGAIKEIKKYGMNFRMYCVSPQIVNWKKPVQASQGKHRASRFDDIRAEFERITRYMEKGDIATLEELVAYLRH